MHVVVCYQSLLIRVYLQKKKKNDKKEKKSLYIPLYHSS